MGYLFEARSYEGVKDGVESFDASYFAKASKN